GRGSGKTAGLLERATWWYSSGATFIYRSASPSNAELSGSVLLIPAFQSTHRGSEDPQSTGGRHAVHDAASGGQHAALPLYPTRGHSRRYTCHPSKANRAGGTHRLLC